MLSSVFGVLAQNLPEIQQTSIWIENFEADGLLDEWQQPLQAYNRDTHIAYSLANDDSYLYLAVKSNRTQKILIGGITLEVARKDNKAVSATFPYNFTYDRRTNPRAASHPDRPLKIADIKEIEVSGISGIQEKTIPLVNEYGILAGVSSITEESKIYENGEIYYLVEIAIPLQYVALDNIEEINYRIALRGIIPPPQFGGVAGFTGNRMLPDGTIVPMPQAEVEDLNQKEVEMYTYTALKGVYRLAQNPD